MLFNSYSYLLFLPVVFILYWFVFKNNVKKQNLLLLLASYIFYASWDYRFLFLLMFSTFLDYITGIRIADAKSERSRKFWFWLSISVNLGFLGVFKYYDFFATSFAALIGHFGLVVHPSTLNIILPVGISFYTFHGLSYVIDIYKKRITPEYNFINYSLFVSFFPLLVAGPIERATHLLPQIQRSRSFSYSIAVDGTRQILWGFFKKIVVADNCAIYVDAIFSSYDTASSGQLIMAAFLFAFQIYGDFSGYSDIALGTARLFGIKLLRNFAYPYFSRDIAEFWRRWHISLSSWFRDYLYVPLGGSKGSLFVKVRNTFIIFLVSGFWHGANWTFIFWGLLNAIYFIPLLLSERNRVNLNIVSENKILPSFKETLQIFTTFFITCFAWIFFRSTSIDSAFQYIENIFHKNGRVDQISWTYPVISILILLLIEWNNRHSEIPFMGFKSRVLRNAVYFFIALAIFFMGAYINPTTFIYFQF
jgi:D-alanyl-lipoteichoic acid acyltransferase DltB (MBOAT superfamily)